jgi:hypothetical protein
MARPSVSCDGAIPAVGVVFVLSAFLAEPIFRVVLCLEAALLTVPPMKLFTARAHSS